MNIYSTTVARDVRIRGRTCKSFPVVATVDGEVQLEVMRYLIHCVANGGAESSLVTYTAHLRDFYEQLGIDGIDVQSVTLDFLNGYRSAIEARASRQYAAQVLRTVLIYLEYLERCGIIGGVIGESGAHQVSIARTKSGRLSHALLKGGASPKSNHVPSEKAIDAIKRFASQQPLYCERFELILLWGHVKGLRAKEVSGLECKQLPTWRSIEAALAEDRSLEVRLVVTKGSKVRNVSVHPLLLSRTRKWIDADRPKLARAAKLKAERRGTPYAPSDAVFLSSSTGKALTPKTLSNMVRGAFKAAVAAGELTESERVWMHGLRKVMINREVTSRPERVDRRPERELMRETGHGTLEGMGRYVVESA